MRVVRSQLLFLSPWCAVSPVLVATFCRRLVGDGVAGRAIDLVGTTVRSERCLTQHRWVVVTPFGALDEFWLVRCRAGFAAWLRRFGRVCGGLPRGKTQRGVTPR